MKKHLNIGLKACLVGICMLGLTNIDTQPSVKVETIILEGDNHRFVSSENGSRAGMNCNRVAYGPWEMFHVARLGNGYVALENLGKWVSSENGNGPITCNRIVRDVWETFYWVDNNDGSVSFRGNNGRYVSSENGGSPMTCKRESIGDWEKFHIIFAGN